MANIEKIPLKDNGMAKISLDYKERVWVTPLGGNIYRMENNAAIFRLDVGDEIKASFDPKYDGIVWKPIDHPIVSQIFNKGEQLSKEIDFTSNQSYGDCMILIVKFLRMCDFNIESVKQGELTNYSGTDKIFQKLNIKIAIFERESKEEREAKIDRLNDLRGNLEKYTLNSCLRALELVNTSPPGRVDVGDVYVILEVKAAVMKVIAAIEGYCMKWEPVAGLDKGLINSEEAESNE